MITTKQTPRTQSEAVSLFGPAPKDLAGFQLLCGRKIELGDLYVYSDEGIAWAVGVVGEETDGEGRTLVGARIYRKGNPPRHEGQTVIDTARHYSHPGPRDDRPDLTGPGALATPEAKAPASVGRLPVNAAARKGIPIAKGFVDYFPDAMAEVARVSAAGNAQHHPGKPLHWDKSKSTDEADALMRHFLDRGTRDTDGQRHTAKVAWRAMALLQREIESEGAAK